VVRCISSEQGCENAVLSAKQTAQFRHLLESRISELARTISAAQQETRAYSARHADPADQAASEYERQAAVHRAEAARQKLKVLKDALHRLERGIYGECAECGGEIERKRLEAIPWTRYCVTCQEAREHP
jgi:RNA polymerase-binding transcription factor